MLFNQICFSNKNIFDLIEFNIFLLIYRMNISNIYFNETNINISLNSLYISIKLTTTLLNRKYIPPNQQYTWNRKYILLKQTYTFSLNQQYICMHQRYIFWIEKTFIQMFSWWNELISLNQYIIEYNIFQRINNNFHLIGIKYGYIIEWNVYSIELIIW